MSNARFYQCWPTSSRHLCLNCVRFFLFTWLISSISQSWSTSNQHRVYIVSFIVVNDVMLKKCMRYKQCTLNMRSTSYAAMSTMSTMLTMLTSKNNRQCKLNSTSYTAMSTMSTMLTSKKYRQCRQYRRC